LVASYVVGWLYLPNIPHVFIYVFITLHTFYHIILIIFLIIEMVEFLYFEWILVQRMLVLVNIDCCVFKKWLQLLDLWQNQPIHLCIHYVNILVFKNKLILHLLSPQLLFIRQIAIKINQVRYFAHK